MPGRRVLLLALALMALSAGSANAAPKEPGREPFFPHTGSFAYNAELYEVAIAYQPRGQRIEATTDMVADARQRLRTIPFDLDGLTVDQAEVDGEAARFRRGRDKLLITPPRPIPKGSEFQVSIAYHGRPQTVVDPDGGLEGWYPTADGALAVGEPQGTAAWFPCNNIPADKASFEIELNVPAGLKAVSNGVLIDRSRHGGRVTYLWGERAPMSTYLAVADIGKGRLEHTKIAGHPAWTLVDPKLAKQAAKPLAKLAEIIRFESSIYGPYPFQAAGSLVDDAPELGYALETQSRPIYSDVPDLTTIVHETAHQWFGDSVGLKRWPNIWLNEGFATWTEWYYAERHGGRTAAETFHRLYRVPASNTKFWNPPSGHPGQAKNLFATSTYVRGGMALEALRERIGTGPFLRLLKTWAREHRHGSGDIAEFIDLAEGVSGRHLTRLFHRWLFTRGKP